jgi:nitrate/nitrite transport system substrate-binding protein
MKKTTTPITSARPTRRGFIKAAVGGAAALTTGGLLSTVLTGCGKAATAAGGDGPETPDMKFGIIALTDCSPIVIAHEKGLFKKYGINSEIVKPANWAAVRDALANGDVQATHMLIGMPIASTMGLGGGNSVPMVIPWLLNRNGQAITLKADLIGKVAGDPKALKPFVDAAVAGGKKMTFAMTFPPGTHAMWIRYYLAAGGIHPDRDVNLITIPPPQMVANMKAGQMDGFCVGEPWNARSIVEEVGFTSVTTQEIWKDHPEKVCAFTQEFAEKNPKSVKACLKALHEASVWLDDMANRTTHCEIVSRDAYIKCPPDAILGRLKGELDYGDGRKKQDEHYMIFSKRNCNYPQPAYGKWWLTQFRRWGMVSGAPDYEGVTKQVFRTDIYEEAMAELGYKHGGRDDSSWTMIDGKSFDPKGDLEAYAKSFPVHAIKG